MTANYVLNHLFVANKIDSDGNIASKSKLIAATKQLDKKTIEYITQLQFVIPESLENVKTWGIVRGNRNAPFILIHAFSSKPDILYTQYIVLTSEVARSIGGNIHSISKLLSKDVPDIDDKPAVLYQLEFKEPVEETIDEQIDAILELMTLTENNVKIMEIILSALVQGKPLYISNAPDSHEDRENFIRGILAMLPPSVRFAVTFLTGSTNATNLDVQLRFYDDNELPTEENAIVYDWETTSIAGAIDTDEYSRFVISQLRLDAQLVIDRTQKLTPATGWRMHEGDRLSEALAYGSHRLKIDDAVLNNQPVSKEDVAEILAKDPTLSDNLQNIYASHLIKFSIAMNELESADTLLTLVADSPRIEEVALKTLQQISESGQEHYAALIALRWISKGEHLHYHQSWLNLAEHSSTAYVRQCAKNNNINDLISFTGELQKTPLKIEKIATGCAEEMLSIATKDALLADNLFLLATIHLNTVALLNLLEMRPFVSQLPPPIVQVWKFIETQQNVMPPDQLIAKAAQHYGSVWAPVICTRFIEIAFQYQRYDLVEPVALQRVVAHAATDRARLHRQILANIAHPISGEAMNTIGEKASLQYLRLLIVMGSFQELAEMLLQLSRTFYAGEAQSQYMQQIYDIFAETEIPDDKVLHHLAELRIHGIKGAPLVMAHIGASQSQTDMPVKKKISDIIDNMLKEQPNLIMVVPVKSLLIVLEDQAKNGDIEAATRTADLISRAIEYQELDGLEISRQMYAIMAKNGKTREAGLETLRVYVRATDDHDARQAVAFFSKKLGASVKANLEATYHINRLLSEVDLYDFAQDLQVATLFLYDTAQLYATKSTPTPNELDGYLSELHGTYSLEERRDVHQNITNLALTLLDLTGDVRNLNKDIKSYMNGSKPPTNTLELLTLMGGYFSKGNYTPLQFQENEVFPLANRTRNLLFTEIETVTIFLNGLTNVFPASKSKTQLHPKAVASELRGLLKLLTPEDRNIATRILANNLQKFVELVLDIGTNGDKRVFESSNYTKRLDAGKQRPKNTVEFYRYLASFLKVRG